ncbi:hypothetical protein WH47_09294 [Habropoda laboriosa]|uniref:Uncharacterized protein n=1 Tax=Habropoda laboriosa TaxID=597456 RepID=A0A0L7R931_9HYME|nr:hypothetical protein WH47_09294 [Habropoda laboriosa]
MHIFSVSHAAMMKKTEKKHENGLSRFECRDARSLARNYATKMRYVFGIVEFWRVF